MAGGLFSRLKIWVKGEKLKFSDLNGEFNNVIQNLLPAKIDDYSVNVSQMQTQTNPGGVGSESLATSLAGELERIRYSINRLQGTTYWYEDPGTNLQAVTEALAFYLPFEEESGLVQDVFENLITRGAIINAKSYNAADVSTAAFDGTNKKFGSYSFGFAVGRLLAYPGRYGLKNRGSLSCWFRNIQAGEYIAYNPNLGIELYIDGSLNLVTRIQKTNAATETTKDFATITGGAAGAVSTFQHAAIRWSVNNAGSDLLKLNLAGVASGSQLTAQTIRTNPHGQQGTWFFGAKPNNPTWNKFSAMSVLPTAEASNPYTLSAGSAGNGTVANGILTIAGQAVYQRSGASVAGVDLSNMVIDFKVSITSEVFTDGLPSTRVFIRDDSMDRQFVMFIGKNKMHICHPSGGASVDYSINHDFSQPTHVRLAFSGATNPKMSIYLDGVKVFTGKTNISIVVTANDTIEFGNYTATNATTSKWEWFAFASSFSAGPVTEASVGNIDDIGVFLDNLSDASVTQLASSSIISTFRSDVINGVTPMVPIFFADDIQNNNVNGQVQSHTGTSQADWIFYFASDGKSPMVLHTSLEANVTNGTGGSANLAADFGVILDSPTLQYSPASGVHKGVLSMPLLFRSPNNADVCRNLLNGMARLSLAAGLYNVSAFSMVRSASTSTQIGANSGEAYSHITVAPVPRTFNL